MAKYRKKPVVIEAEVYRLGLEDDFQTVTSGSTSEGVTERTIYPYLNTLEGPMRISEGDYIITGIKGERYPCKPDIFAATYELVEE